MKNVVKIIIAICVLLALMPIALSIDLSSNLEESAISMIRETEPLERGIEAEVGARSIEPAVAAETAEEFAVAESVDGSEDYEDEYATVEDAEIEDLAPPTNKEVDIVIGTISVTSILIAVGGLVFLLNKDIKL